MIRNRQYFVLQGGHSLGLTLQQYLYYTTFYSATFTYVCSSLGTTETRSHRDCSSSRGSAVCFQKTQPEIQDVQEEVLSTFFRKCTRLWQVRTFHFLSQPVRLNSPRIFTGSTFQDSLESRVVVTSALVTIKIKAD